MSGGRESWSDAELVAAIADGDRSALRSLYVRHQPWVTVRLRHRCSDPDVVAEAVLLPALGGGLVAIAAIIAQLGRGRDITQMYAFALLVSTAGIGFALDDPAAEMVAASPSTLARRRVVRIVLAATFTLVAWTMIAVAVGASPAERFPAAEIVMELIALAAMGLATSAAVQRHTGSPGGPTAALAVLVGPVFMLGVVFRDVRVFPSLVPGQDMRERWVWVAIAALVALLRTSRDPVAPADLVRRGSRRG